MNNPFLGLFFSDVSSVITSLSEFKMATESTEQYKTNQNYKPSDSIEIQSTRSDPSLNYKFGSHLKSLSISKLFFALTGVLKLPSNVLNGQCVNSPVKFLVNSDSKCTFFIDKDSCVKNSFLRFDFYLQENSMNFNQSLLEYQQVLSNLNSVDK